MTDLSGRELDEACAKARGDALCNRHRECVTTRTTTGPKGLWHTPIPLYHASFDDAYRDLWPECQRRGCTEFQMYVERQDCEVFILTEDYDGARRQGRGPTAPEAFARACLAALQEVRE